MNKFWYTYVPLDDYAYNVVKPKAFKTEAEAKADAKERNIFFRSEKTKLTLGEFQKELDNSTFL